LQFDPLQHSAAAVPHARQVPPEQVSDAVVVELHTLPLQQAWVAPPHATQVPALLHTLPAAVHGVLPPQHG